MAAQRTVKGRLGGAALILTGAAVSSNVLSFVKSVLMAKYFGISWQMDAYYAALIVPTLVAGLIQGTAESTLLPLLVEGLQRNRRSALLGAAQYGTILLIFSTLFAVVAGTFAPAWVGMVVPGLGRAGLQATVGLTRYAVWLVPLNVLIQVDRSGLQAQGYYGYSEFSTLANAVVNLAYLVVKNLYSPVSPEDLMISLLVGAGLQMAMLHVRVWALGDPIIARPMRSEFVNRALALVAPWLMGSVLVQVTLMIDQVMASMLPAGNVAALNYGSRLYQIVSQLLIMSLCSAVLPFFSELLAQGKRTEVKELFGTLVSQLAFILIPLSIGIHLVGRDVLAVVFQRGQFGPDASKQVADVWTAFGYGAFPFAAGVLGVRLLTAMYKPRIITAGSLVSLGTNLVLDYVLMRYWKAPGIAAATSIAYALTMVMLLSYVRKELGDLPFRSWWASIRTIAVLTVAMVAVVVLLQRLPLAPVLRVITTTGFGAATYLGGALLLRVPELQRLLALVGLRRRREANA